jgi:DNA-binding NtrC family response regulator
LPAELVISDLRMPGITGLSVLGGLRDLELRIPFILITAFGDAGTHALAHQLGATAVLDKPFDMPSFLGLVRACVATY